VSGIHVRSTSGKLEDNLNNAKDLRKEQYVTGQNIGSGRRAMDTIAMGVYLVATDVIEAGSNNNLVNLTAHGAKQGDILQINTSANNIQEFEVVIDEIISPNSFRLGAVLSADLSVGDAVSILRPVTPRMSSTGATLATIAPSPITFRLDGAVQEVVEDTGTPGNNVPLPVKLSGVTGDVNITAGDLNVQLSDQGVNADVTRIGDGTNQLGITGSNEAKVSDSSALTQLQAIVTALGLTNGYVDGVEGLLTTIAGKDFATQTTLAAALTKLTSLDGKDFATQTTLAALLAELQNKADLSETQPVSMATIPLATGAATATKQDDQTTQLTAIAGKDFATQTTLAAVKTDTGAVSTGIGAPADTAVTNPALSATVIGALKGLVSLITTLNSKLDVIDQNTSAALNSTSNTTTVTNTLLSAPASAIGMIVQNSVNADSGIRFTASGTTPTASVGFYLGPGQSTSYMPAASIRTISVDGGAIDVSVIWFV
jgi:hypothetical protein